MNFNLSYYYLRSHKKKHITDNILLTFLCILIWIASIIYLINISVFNRNHWAVGPFIFTFGSTILLPIVISILFPFGRGSLSITDGQIQFIPIRFLFNMITMKRITINLSKHVEINYNKRDEIISFKQDTLNEDICIFGIEEKSKKEIINALQYVASKNKNIIFM
jgi:hypothetical protein